MSLPRIFFDTNDGTMTGGFWLGFDQSKKDLEKLGEDLCDGTHVIICMPDELEMQAILRFDANEGVWFADPIDDTITYLNGSLP